MKTLEQILTYKSKALDGRDLGRLVKFIPEDKLPLMGVTLKPELVGKHAPLPFTRENIINELRIDINFAFDKALNQRGISSSLMHNVVRMWNWVLEEGLEDNDDYAQYGLPLFKATAVKYGFDNPIGDDDGDEAKYSSDGE